VWSGSLRSFSAPSHHRTARVLRSVPKPSGTGARSHVSTPFAAALTTFTGFAKPERFVETTQQRPVVVAVAA
jgi:hypothetical protein